MDYKLSIITTTFNSSDFIKDTVEGVLNQNFGQSFEYIISDDGSADDTVKIVDQIKNRHPKGNSINIIQHEENQGVMKNFFGAVLKSKGEYIAFCDSDDVWSDPYKLTKQIDYLDNHKKCVIAYHSFINRIDEGLDPALVKNFDETKDQVVMNPQTSTMMVRGILRNLVSREVINEAARSSQNDQYLRFLLKDMGYFKPLTHIEPNIRLVREGSIYCVEDTLSKKEVALGSWKIFYKHHGHGKNRRYLGKKVNGFQSAVNWAEYEMRPSSKKYREAMLFDILNGVLTRKFLHRIRKVIFTPLVLIRNRAKQLLTSS